MAVAAASSSIAEPGKVVCPACTFHNPLTADVCEMCGTPLPEELKRKAEDPAELLQAFLSVDPHDLVAASRKRAATQAELRRLREEVQARAEVLGELLEKAADTLATTPARVVAKNADPGFATVRLWRNKAGEGGPTFVDNGSSLDVVRLEPGNWTVVRHLDAEWFIRSTNTAAPEGETKSDGAPVVAAVEGETKSDGAPAVAAVEVVSHDLVHFTGPGVDRSLQPASFNGMVRAARFIIEKQEPDPENSTAREWKMGEQWEHCGFARKAGSVSHCVLGPIPTLVIIKVAYEVDEGDCAGVRYNIRGPDGTLLDSETGLVPEAALSAFAKEAGLVKADLGVQELKDLHLLFLDMVHSCYMKVTTAAKPVHLRQEDVDIGLQENLGEIVPDLLPAA